MLNTPIGRLRIAAMIEGCSYLLFALTMPLKYVYEIKGPNKVIGMLHGIMFMVYILLVIQVAWQKKWSLSQWLLALIASVVPGGTFYADKKLFKPAAIAS